MTRCSLLVLTALWIGCGGERDESSAPAATAPSTCDEYELELSDGSCRRPGVPLDGCGAGFVHDGVYGCDPILPADVCPSGSMAVPGDGRCRAIMECGEGKWGDIPVDATTEYVDGAYVGGQCDGSEARPWTNIADAVAAAAAGALIAVAEGSYAESILIRGKPVRLWGVCPERVEIVASNQPVVAGCPPAALCMLNGASGSEVVGLAARGAGNGITLSGSLDVLFDRVWLHDNAIFGIDAEAALGPTAFELRDSLVEKNVDLGVFALGAAATVDGSLVRDTAPRASDNRYGTGISVQIMCTVTPTGLACDPGGRASILLRGSLIEQNYEAGLSVAGSDAAVETSVLRTNLTSAFDARRGYGITVQIACKDTPSGPSCDPTSRSTLAVQSSVIERNRDVGLFVTGSDLTVDTTVVRATLPRPSSQVRGHGIQFQLSCLDTPTGGVVCDPATRSTAMVRGSLIDQNQSFGVLVLGSDLTMEDSVVQRTLARTSDELFGDGFTVKSEFAPASATIRRALIADTARAGVSSFGGLVSLADSRIRCAAFALDGEAYDGQDFEFDDGGGNRCGCPTASDNCKLVSAGLEPPEPVEAP